MIAGLAPIKSSRTVVNVQRVQRDKWVGNNMCTFVPYKMISLSKVLNVREVAITPTSMEAITRPVMIQTTANNLAHTPTGTLSPYLTNEHKHSI